MIFGICWGFDDSLGASLPDGFHRICDAWNGLVDQPWRMMSLGLRAWACRF